MTQKLILRPKIDFHRPVWLVTTGLDSVTLEHEHLLNKAKVTRPDPI